MSVLVVVLAYLIGSVQVGVLYSRARGEDIRAFDAPGASGIYRRYGLNAAVLVTVLDLLKGALAVWIALELAPEAVAWAVFTVVTGHNFPVFFGFDGGAGIVPGIGAYLLARPLEMLALFALAVLVGTLYHFTLRKRMKMFVVPFAALSSVVLMLLFLLAGALGGQDSGFWPLLAFGVAMALRSVGLLLRGRRVAG